jgi:hypothetical protein
MGELREAFYRVEHDNHRVWTQLLAIRDMLRKEVGSG